MAVYEKVFDETKDVFDDVLSKTSIPDWVNIELLSNNNLKEIFQVKRLSDLFETLTNGTNLVILVNEEIFDELSDELKKLVFEEALAGISVDFESGVISLNKHDFSTFSGFLEKYGANEIIRYKESVKSVYDKKKQEKEELRAANKGKRGRKKKNVE